MYSRHAAPPKLISCTPGNSGRTFPCTPAFFLQNRHKKNRRYAYSLQKRLNLIIRLLRKMCNKKLLLNPLPSTKRVTVHGDDVPGGTLGKLFPELVSASPKNNLVINSYSRKTFSPATCYAFHNPRKYDILSTKTDITADSPITIRCTLSGSHPPGHPRHPT